MFWLRLLQFVNNPTTTCKRDLHGAGPFPSQAEALQSQVEQVTAEKAAAFDARVQAESRLAALEAELADACSEMEQAKRTGTPKGEGGPAGAARVEVPAISSSTAVVGGTA